MRSMRGMRSIRSMHSMHSMRSMRSMRRMRRMRRMRSMRSMRGMSSMRSIWRGIAGRPANCVASLATRAASGRAWHASRQVQRSRTCHPARTHNATAAMARSRCGADHMACIARPPTTAAAAAGVAPSRMSA